MFDAIKIATSGTVLNPLYEETELSASSADSTLQIVKEQQPILTDKPQHPLRLAATWMLWFVNQIVQSEWWRMTGSNRRPPACKAGALPAELIPREFNFRGGSGWIRTSDPRLIKTVL